MKKKITMSVTYDGGFNHKTVDVNVRRYVKENGIDIACRSRNNGTNLFKMRDVFDKLIKGHENLYVNQGYRFLSAQMSVTLANGRRFSFSIRPNVVGGSKLAERGAVNPTLLNKAAELLA